MLAQPLPDLASWSQYLQRQPIPVLLETAEELRQLAEIEARLGTVDAHQIEDAVGDDPLMTLQVLTHVSQHRTDRQVTDVHTVTAAVMLMGIGPFFETFSSVLVLDDHLVDYPQAISEVRRLIGRAWCAARLVTEFSLLHAEGHASALQKVALLHGQAEILLWCHAPVLAQALQARRAQDPLCGAGEIERGLLNIELIDLEHRLIRDWAWPAMLQRLTDPTDKRSQVLLQPQRRLLAVSLALADRINRLGSDAVLTLDELEDLSELLTLSPTAVQRLVENTLA